LVAAGIGSRDRLYFRVATPTSICSTARSVSGSVRARCWYVGSGTSPPLGDNVILRGLAPSADNKKLFVNASRELLVIDLESGKVGERLAFDAPQTGVVLAPDGRRAYLAQTVHEGGGAITVVGLAPLRLQGKIHLTDISPWTIALHPRPAVAAR
jgi:DNA-binding beta-propeller fold protein YncE